MIRTDCKIFKVFGNCLNCNCDSAIAIDPDEETAWKKYQSETQDTEPEPVQLNLF